MLRHFFLGLQADALSHRGRYADALKSVDEAIAEVARTGERFYAPELYRLRAHLLTKDEATARDAVRESLDRSRELAREQGAVGFEPRITESLGRLIDSP